MTKQEIKNGGEEMLIDRPDQEPVIPDGFNSNYLKVYYGKFYEGFFLMLISSCRCPMEMHPGCDNSYFGQKEFSFTLDNDTYLSFQSFNGASELENAIKEKCPFKIYIRPVYTVDMVFVLVIFFGCTMGVLVFIVSNENSNKMFSAGSCTLSFPSLLLLSFKGSGWRIGDPPMTSILVCFSVGATKAYAAIRKIKGVRVVILLSDPPNSFQGKAAGLMGESHTWEINHVFQIIILAASAKILKGKLLNDKWEEIQSFYNAKLQLTKNSELVVLSTFHVSLD
ncbi:hypothetical protein Patl1_17541 [Pistacia atlantica]|uniref:Uncharacterized protein n=1 Tax=Pistacia atlantica TaxID=434234 RepID=A0ACC1BZL0_9ROSI|nr:hypothetical protein Patl1_17541 [Pistacia atlantica]